MKQLAPFPGRKVQHAGRLENSKNMDLVSQRYNLVAINAKMTTKLYL
jgi:hypothetical protein